MTLEVGSQPICMKEGGAVCPDIGSTANLVRFRRVAHSNSLFAKMGLPRIMTYGALANLKFRDGRMDDVRYAADISADIAGAKDNFAAVALAADLPALLRKGALGALRGKLDFSWYSLTFGFRGWEFPSWSMIWGATCRASRILMGVVAIEHATPVFRPPWVEVAFSRMRLNPACGGIRLPFAGDGMCSFTPSRTFSACKAATLGAARDGALSDPKQIIMDLHVNWRRAPAQQIRRV